MVTHLNKWKKLTFIQIESEISETGPAVGSDYMFNQKYDYVIADTDYKTYMLSYLCYNLGVSDFESEDLGPSMDKEDIQE